MSDKGTFSIFFAIEFEIEEGTDSNLIWKKLAFINSRLESRRGFHETTHMLHQETCSSERFATPMLERIFELVSANEVFPDEFFGFTVIVDSASPITSLEPIHVKFMCMNSLERPIEPMGRSSKLFRTNTIASHAL